MYVRHNEFDIFFLLELAIEKPVFKKSYHSQNGIISEEKICFVYLSELKLISMFRETIGE